MASGVGGTCGFVRIVIASSFYVRSTSNMWSWLMDMQYLQNCYHPLAYGKDTGWRYWGLAYCCVWRQWPRLPPPPPRLRTVANIPLRSGIGVDSGGNWYRGFHFFKNMTGMYFCIRDCWKLLRSDITRKASWTSWYPRNGCWLSDNLYWTMAACSLLTVIHSSIRE